MATYVRRIAYAVDAAVSDPDARIDIMCIACLRDCGFRIMRHIHVQQHDENLNAFADRILRRGGGQAITVMVACPDCAYQHHKDYKDEYSEAEAIAKGLMKIAPNLPAQAQRPLVYRCRPDESLVAIDHIEDVVRRGPQ